MMKTYKFSVSGAGGAHSVVVDGGASRRPTGAECFALRLAGEGNLPGATVRTTCSSWTESQCLRGGMMGASHTERELEWDGTMPAAYDTPWWRTYLAA